MEAGTLGNLGEPLDMTLAKDRKVVKVEPHTILVVSYTVD